MSSYVLITPAHNEEKFIQATLSSMIGQRVLPLKWVVVDDGSTDRTREIVSSYLPRHSFLELVQVQRSDGRDFGHKARAFNRGLERLGGLQFDFIGNLDADISIQPDYFERVLQEFDRDPNLGIAGGMVHSQIGNGFVSQKVSLDSVAGAVQLFRRECFREIGGYVPLPLGGIDSAAEIKARMRGWKVRTFPALVARENRRTGSANARPLASRIREGKRFHSLGYGTPFFTARCLARVADSPMLLGSMAALLGFLGSKFRNEPLGLPSEVVRFLRQEQRYKLRAVLMRLFRLPPTSLKRFSRHAGQLHPVRGLHRD